MGYTNYWTPNKAKLDKMVEFPQELLDKVRNIANTYNTRADGKLCVSIKLNPKSIVIIGTSEGFEFDLYKDSHTGDRIGVDSWEFCKTYREPYDAVIKCVLMLLTSYGLLLEWSHDDNGNCTEHRKAIALAKKCDIPIVHNYYPASDVAK